MTPGKNRERALLVGTPHNKTDGEVTDSLDELSRLAETAGACVGKTMVQSLKRVDASLLIGKGKAEEVNAALQSLPIDLIVFDDELTPTQQRNLEAIFNTKTIYRTRAPGPARRDGKEFPRAGMQEGATVRAPRPA